MKVQAAGTIPGLPTSSCTNYDPFQGAMDNLRLGNGWVSRSRLWRRERSSADTSQGAKAAESTERATAGPKRAGDSPPVAACLDVAAGEAGRTVQGSFASPVWRMS